MYAYVGCFTTPQRKARGKGISVYHVNASSGHWRLVQIFPTLDNPGYLVADPTQNFLYACHGDGDSISAYQIDKSNGHLSFLNKQHCQGDNAPHLMIEPSGRFVVIANGPGIALIPREKNGLLLPLTEALVPQGVEGPYKREQGLGAHPHQVIMDPSGRFLLCPDKGADAIHLFQIDLKNGRLIVHDPACTKTRYGAGPRHMVFHPQRALAYVINELDSTLTTYEWDAIKGRLIPRHIVPTTPPHFTGDNTGAEIVISADGRHIYISNRGHNSIATFQLDPQDGTPQAIDWQPTQGEKPRFFTLDPSAQKLFVANEDSDTIVEFKIDPGSAIPQASGLIISTPSPSCVVFCHSI
jgi:6-phosphogluconolactonase (cycloisomerase 2 family)